MFKDYKYSVISITYITSFFRFLLLSTRNVKMSEGTFCRVEVHLCADEFTVKKIVCREFAKVQFSYSFSLWYSEKKSQAFAKVLFSYSFSLWYNEKNSDRVF